MLLSPFFPQLRLHSALSVIGRNVLAGALAAAAIANLLTVFLAHPAAPTLVVEGTVDLDTLGWGREGAALTALLLLIAARALAHGKRRAWFLCIGLLAFSVLSVIVSHDHRNYLPITLGLVFALLALAPLFSTRSDPRAVLRGYGALLLSVACLIAMGAIGHLWRVDLLTGPRVTRREVFFALRTLVFLFLGYGVVEILRPVLRVRRVSQAETQRTREIVATHGRLTTAYFALGAGMSYFWSASGRSVIAYRLVSGVALALGDPIGPEEEHLPLVRAFLDHCRRQDWPAAWYLASPELKRVARPWNLHMYKIGEEALVAVERFTTQGKIGAPVRHAMTRARRDGVHVVCWQGGPLPASAFAGMKRVSQAWLEARHMTMQMGFSMGRFPADWSQEMLTAVGLDAAGEVCAFLTWTSLFNGNGWSLDVMRRMASAPPGIMELLIAECIGWARERGYRAMSLGLAPLAGLDAGLASDLRTTEAAPRPWLERGMSVLYRWRLLLGSYASLHAFKSKFQPEWQARYLVVADRRALPQVLAALARAQGYSLPGMIRDLRESRGTEPAMPREAGYSAT